MFHNTLQIRFLSFIGPKKELAKIDFGPGLNLVYGPSNTGKSSILDAIDFMLGRERKLKEIPEHEGYDQVLLGLEFSTNEKYTLFRSISGGDYELYSDLHWQKPEKQDSIVLRTKKPTKKIQSISNFILGKLDFEDKKLKKNEDNSLVSLTLRNYLPITIISETDIQKEASPYISEQYADVPTSKSRLKLLLTGVDDSALLPAEMEKKRVSRNAKIDILDELIAEKEVEISEISPNGDSPNELSSQLNRLNESIQNRQRALVSTEEQYGQLIASRATSRQEQERNTERLAEISEMLGRFRLLEEQYQSDILRIINIKEAGTLFNALEFDKCPFCGSQSLNDSGHAECAGNVSNLIPAAEAEQDKIKALKIDLSSTMVQLKEESAIIEREAPKLKLSIDKINEQIKVIAPEIETLRNKFSDLLSVKNQVDRSIKMLEQLV